MIASLRGRLVAGVLVLAAAGMLLVGGVTYATQRSFQLDRVDAQLASAVEGLQREFIGRHGGNERFKGRGGPPPGGGAPSDTYGQLRDTSGNVLDEEFLGPDDTGEAPDLPKDIRLDSASARPVRRSTLRTRASSSSRLKGLVT